MRLKEDMVSTPPPRVRIAPSPTGDPHIGTAYIALFNYAFAKKNGGKFIVRIEDTDQTRFRAMSEAMILDALKWVGLTWDEGPDVGGPHAPYKQSQRLSHYKAHAERLVQTGKAYRCFCASERLEAVRKAQAEAKATTGYDRHCRELSQAEIEASLRDGKPHTIRFMSPIDGVTRFQDRLRGAIEFENKQLDDLVLLKSDGFPTYHLASIVDDHLMEITHVIRGEEWLSSTPKHVLLYQASGWEAPEFVHLPLLRNPDKSKISKRKNPTSIFYYKRKGILPDALRNFLALMGWSMGGDREIFTTQEMIAAFTWDRMSLGGPVFDLKKLSWLNGEYLKKISDQDYLGALRSGIFSDEYLLKIIPLIKERVHTLEDFIGASQFFFSGDLNYEGTALPAKDVSTKDASTWLTDLIERIELLDEWNAKVLHDVADTYLKEKGLKPKNLFMTLRVVLTGVAGSTPLMESMEVLGKEIVRRRFRMAIEFLKTVQQKG